MSAVRSGKSEGQLADKKSINNDETLSALSAISAAAAQCLSTLAKINSAPSFTSDASTDSSTVSRLKKAKRMDMLYRHMSLSGKDSDEKVAEEVAAVPPSPPEMYARPESGVQVAK